VLLSNACTPSAGTTKDDKSKTAAESAEPNPSGTLELPNLEQARDAFIAMMDMHEYKEQATIKLGTCIPAVDAEHKGQIACSAALTIGAGTSEA
jgi:hypothetical protein